MVRINTLALGVLLWLVLFDKDLSHVRVPRFCGMVAMVYLIEFSPMSAVIEVPFQILLTNGYLLLISFQKLLI